jgi:hypothetical protein
MIAKPGNWITYMSTKVCQDLDMRSLHCLGGNDYSHRAAEAVNFKAALIPGLKGQHIRIDAAPAST